MLDTYLASVPVTHSRMAAVSPSSAVQFPLPYLPAPPPPPPPTPISYGATFQSKISPSILLIILILSVIFFVSGLLHLLVRCLLGRPASRESAGDDADIIHATAFQGQLQQLFHLHDAGVDQAFIDSLPVFHYRSIVGAKRDPFDCAVCLCEFADDDRLRLLPKCSHAFHVACIDTWLLSHSTCPLCRRCLLADFPPYGGGRSPLVLVLDSGSDSSGRDFAESERLDTASSARLGLVIEEASALEGDHKQTHKDEVVVPVKLGKFRSQAVDSSSCSAKPSLDQRRCYSMGSYEYVMDETSVLQVAVKPSAKTHPALRKAGHRIAMSECDCHSKRESFRGLNAPKILPDAAAAAGGPDGGHTKQPAMQKKESFSVSKIWMRGGRKDRASASQQRVSSFRLPLQRGRGDVSPVTESEYNVSAWDKSEKSVSGSAVDWDLEAAAAGASWNGLHSRADEAPSFARRTLLWIRGHL